MCSIPPGGGGERLGRAASLRTRAGGGGGGFGRVSAAAAALSRSTARLLDWLECELVLAFLRERLGP